MVVRPSDSLGTPVWHSTKYYCGPMLMKYILERNFVHPIQILRTLDTQIKIKPIGQKWMFYQFNHTTLSYIFMSEEKDIKFVHDRTMGGGVPCLPTSCLRSLSGTQRDRRKHQVYMFESPWNLTKVFPVVFPPKPLIYFYRTVFVPTSSLFSLHSDVYVHSHILSLAMWSIERVRNARVRCTTKTSRWPSPVQWILNISTISSFSYQKLQYVCIPLCFHETISVLMLSPTFTSSTLFAI